MVEKIIVANPRGFCAGVSRAIDIVDLALKKYGSPIYVRHAIVHNDQVVKDLEQKGAIFVESLQDIPKGSYVIFSAHGSAPTLKKEALDLGLQPIDAVCPLVTKVHVEARRFARHDYTIIYIGHKGHQETMGTMAYASMHLVETIDDVEKLDIAHNEKMCILTQTTLSIDDTKKILEALKEKYPHIKETPKEDICYATTNRQGAVKALATQCELILIIGAQTSSNSLRLVETAKYAGASSYLVLDASHVNYDWFDGVQSVGISSGASVPDELVNELITSLEKKYQATKENLVFTTENVTFTLPDELIDVKLD